MSSTAWTETRITPFTQLDWPQSKILLELDSYHQTQAPLAKPADVLEVRQFLIRPALQYCIRGPVRQMNPLMLCFFFPRRSNLLTPKANTRPLLAQLRVGLWHLNSCLALLYRL